MDRQSIVKRKRNRNGTSSSHVDEKAKEEDSGCGREKTMSLPEVIMSTKTICLLWFETSKKYRWVKRKLLKNVHLEKAAASCELKENELGRQVCAAFNAV